MATLNEDLTSKLLEIQREIIPQVTTLAALFNPVNPSNPVIINNLRRVGGGLGITVLPIELNSPDKLDAVLQDIAERRPDALQIVADFGDHRFER